MNKKILCVLLAALLMFFLGCGDMKEKTPAASESPETGSDDAQAETTVELPQLDSPVFDTEPGLLWLPSWAVIRKTICFCKELTL